MVLAKVKLKSRVGTVKIFEMYNKQLDKALEVSFRARVRVTEIGNKEWNISVVVN